MDPGLVTHPDRYLGGIQTSQGFPYREFQSSSRVTMRLLLLLLCLVATALCMPTDGDENDVHVEHHDDDGVHVEHHDDDGAHVEHHGDEDHHDDDGAHVEHHGDEDHHDDDGAHVEHHGDEDHHDDDGAHVEHHGDEDHHDDDGAHVEHHGDEDHHDDDDPHVEHHGDEKHHDDPHVEHHDDHHDDHPLGAHWEHHSHCGPMQRIKVKEQWFDILNRSERERRGIWKALFKAVSKQNPAFKDHFLQRHHNDRQAVRAHLMRIVANLGISITLLDNPHVLDAHLTYVKDNYLGDRASTFFDALEHSLMEVVPAALGRCFDHDAWQHCIQLIHEGMTH